MCNKLSPQFINIVIMKLYNIYDTYYALNTCIILDFMFVIFYKILNIYNSIYISKLLLVYKIKKLVYGYNGKFHHPNIYVHV